MRNMYNGGKEMGFSMDDESWVQLTAREQVIVLEAVQSMLRAGTANNVEVANLTVKLARSKPHPDITVGVHGGLVQWIVGNPFPIRVCDYDGFDLPDVDEHGRPCDVWFHQPNTDGVPQ
jgi:hypothetical protein